MKRVLFASVLALSLDVASALADTPHWTQPYNIVWTEPGTNGLSSMPAGGGNIGLNVWAQNDAVVFYISSPDSFNAQDYLTKLARVRLTVSPNPFADSLRQELDLESNTVLVSGRTAGGTAVSLRIWADAHQPVVHVEGTASNPVSVTATLELDGNWQMTAQATTNGVIWSRRVPGPSAYRAGIISGQGLQTIADMIPDTLGNLTCGGLLVGAGFAPGASGTGTNEGRPCSTAPLTNVTPVTTFALRAALRIAQDATADAWTNEVRQLAALTETTQAADRETSAAWWRTFWDRSRIVINPDSTKTNDPAWEAGRNYQLFRAMLAANSSGRYMTMFNSGFFTCDADPDARPWDFCRFMGQNQRHLYWPLLKSGDADMLKVGTDFYVRSTELQRARLKLFLGVDGVVYTEGLNTMGLSSLAGERTLGMYPFYNTSGLEFVLMMIEAHRYFGADLAPCLPAIEGAARFYDNFYRQENKKRTGSELNEKGQLVITPVNICESGTNYINGTDSLSGLIALSETVLALPEGTIPAEMRTYFQGFRNILPPIATYRQNKHTIISMHQNPLGGYGTGELPQLYPVYPFSLYGVGKPNLELARDTWTSVGGGGPAFCWWHDNVIVARLGLTEDARHYALVKLRFPIDYDLPDSGWWRKGTPARTRFPAFFDVRLDGPVDMDHGGSAMVGLQDMLLQTDGKRILLLPAWPADWDVDFKLHAPDQTTVEGKVRGGKLASLSVTPLLRWPDVEVMAPYRNPMAIAVDPANVEVLLPVRFDATQVTNIPGRIAAYDWDFGDGATGHETVATHTYNTPGSYPVLLRITMEDGQTNVTCALVTVRPVDTVPPTVASVGAAGRSDQLIVTFSEPVRQDDAETAANYTIEPGITLLAASLGTNLTTVTLTTSPFPLSAGDFALSVRNVRDRALTPNVIAPDTLKNFHYTLLYAWWKVNDGTGLAAADASGNNWNGTLKGGPAWTHVAGRAALSFDGVDDIVEFSTTLEDLTLPFSISFWVNPAALQNGTVNIFGNHPPGIVMQNINGANRFNFYSYNNCVLGPMDLTAGQWQHVAIICGEQKAFCYLNGVEMSSATNTGDFLANQDLTFRLGQGYSEGRFFAGLLSDFRIYRAALSATDVQTLKNAPTNPPPSAILTSVSSVSVPEGGTNTFQVRLSSQPTNSVVVAVAWTAGDSDITVTGGTNLTFTTNNWATYQTVTLAAAEDDDAVNGTASITCSSPGMDAVTVTATEAENDTINNNQTPVIAEGASANVTMSEDGAPTAFALTLHATDADGDTLTWSVATPAAHGTATASGTGASQAIAYTPIANYNGADSFAIQVADGVGGAATTLVSVTIEPVNDAPVAVAQSVSTLMNTAKAITLSGSDPEGSNLTYAVATQPTYGTLSGTAATRTYTPNTGYLGTDSFTFLVNDGALDSPPATVSILVGIVSATGGTVTNYTEGGTNWTAHIFTNKAASTSLVFSVGGTVEYLIVAGGGGGGGSQYHGAGGGAGGLLFGSSTVTTQTYYVVVGAGGAALAANSTARGNNGGNSSFNSLTAIGGGGGGNYSSGAGKNGGSGGGGCRAYPAGGLGTSGQGNIGGAGVAGNGDPNYGSGGGGGAGAVGGAGTTNYAGDGGVGLELTQFAAVGGSPAGWFAGGGGGGTYNGTSNGTGGKGGGGAATGTVGADGVANTGGGGGGPRSHQSYVSGAGGSGIVIVRYAAGVASVAPAAPTGFAATTVATNQINLAWTDQATNETGYVVDRSLDSNSWVQVVVTSANITNTSSIGLTTNTLYYYRVAATNAAGRSAYCFASARTWSVYEVWLLSHFGGADLINLSISGATADPDHDGLNNEREFWAGTNPTNASSCLAIIAPTNNPVVAGGGFVVSWQSVTGKTYSVLAATNLLTGFSSLTNGLPATPTVNVYTDKVNGAGQKFYRVGVE